MTKRERFTHLQALVKSLLDELASLTPKPPAKPPPAPKAMGTHRMFIRLNGEPCCAAHNAEFDRQSRRHT